MTAISKGLLVAMLHVLMVLSLGGKLLFDRAHRPRVWVKTASFDPDLPIRGRYVALRLQVQAPWFQPRVGYEWSSVTLNVQDGTLVAQKSEAETGLTVSLQRSLRANSNVMLLDQGVLFFLPEHADFPRLNPGDELWAEVTIPKKGPPRPIQLALKRGTEWKPLNYR